MKKPVVTDHAVVRYLQHFADVDVERIRHLIHLKTKTAVNSGAKSIKIDGCDYRIKSGRVVTVVPEKRTRKLAAAAFGEWDQSKEKADGKCGPVQLETNTED